MGKLQKMLPSHFVIEAILMILKQVDFMDSVNKDLLLSMILFLNDVLLDTQLEERRLKDDERLQKTLKMLSSFLLSLDLSGEADPEDFEVACESEREVLLGVGVLSCLKSYLTVTMKGRSPSDFPDLFVQLTLPLKKIAQNFTLNVRARHLAVETLCSLSERVDPIIITELKQAEKASKAEKNLPNSDNVQNQLTAFVKQIVNSQRVKNDLKNEKMELVDIIECVEIITNPQEFASLSENLKGEECPEIVQTLMEKTEELGRSNIITLADVLLRFRKFFTECIGQKDKEATCISAFDVLSMMLERKVEKVKAVEGLNCSAEEKEKLAADATDALVELQNLFGKLGLMDCVYSAIQWSPDTGIGKAAFELGREMLWGGNREVQQSFDVNVRNCDPNGLFFRNIRDLLRGFVAVIKETRQTKKYYPAFYEPPTLTFEEAQSLFDFLQQLVEGYFIAMQNNLREQPFNRTSYNLIDSVISVAVTLGKDRLIISKMIDSELQTVLSALNLLINVVAGPCPGNQIFTAASQIVELCNYIITTEIFSNLTKPEIGFEVRQKACALLAACLEGRPDYVIEKLLASKLEKGLTNEAFIYLHTTLSCLTQSGSDEDAINAALGFKNSHSAADKHGSELLDGVMSKNELQHFAIFCLDFCCSHLFFVRSKLSMLDELKQILAPPKATDASQAALCLAYDELLQRLGYIEVNWMGRIEIFYFPMPSEAASLTQSSMEKFETEADLETQDSRVKALMGAADGFCDEMLVLDALKTNHWYMFIKGNFSTIQTFGFFVAVIINLLAILGVTGSTIHSMRAPAAKGLLLFLSFVAMFGNINVMLFFVTSISQLVLRRLTRDFRGATEENLGPEAFTTYGPLTSWGVSLMGYIFLCITICLAFAEFQGPAKSCFGIGAVVFSCTLLQSIRGCILVPSNKFTLWFCVAYDVLFDGKVLSNLIFTVLPAVGCYVNVFFFTILLCNIVSLSGDANNVLLAVIKPGRALLVTGVLFIIVILVFSTLGFILYGSQNFCEAGDCELTPRNLFDTCWLVIDGGIRSGDIGGLMTGTSHEDSEAYLQRVLFMLVFFIVLGALLFNMVTGIICDTFSALREESLARAEKMGAEAFISGITREQYDEVGLIFEDLTSRDQNIWNYIYCLLYLNKKDPSEYTGVEQYIQDSVSTKDYNWFPIFQSYQLQQIKQVEVEGVSVQAQLAASNLKINEITKRVEQRDEKIDTLSGQMDKLMNLLSVKSH